MLRNILWVLCFGLVVAGCASDGKTVSSDVSSSMSSGGAAASTPTTSNSVVAESNPTMSEGGGSGSTMTATTPADSGVTLNSRSSENRIAAGIDEETLDTCLAHIPQDGTTGQKMLAEQTCRRNFATRR